MKNINIRSLNLTQSALGVLLSLFATATSHAQLKVKPGEKVTTVEERQ